ncbi:MULTISPECIES: Ger(x)C family spore germination protein [unclassified Bacillus (in: firmicutes)]|uniref:Ger(x)C family spore germination protein n=1 Tax=unclassified Bacillus (in: firmicutes) TaxID=185979 RepID=UPI0008E275A0|nr:MULTISPECIES: Ger(x)C family spore germination protein [unclassified Bacillus (in: firmicutes)]SFA87874.1 germination protein, Ger(x)C family [Bacillus sp. UNCCL13]SFQ84443.1 germination protein, Ger(x)C family [Bacillus sp. cl95]
MTNLRTLLSILILFTILFSLTGCWDKTEVEERAYVIGIGMDKSKIKDMLEITFLIANPEVGSQQGGGSSNEPPQEVITITANDLITARNSANALVARAITYDLMRIIVVSEEFAKDKDFIRWIYDAAKDREIRRDVHLAVSKEKASLYFKNNKPKMETRPHKYFQFMTNRGIEAGLIPDSDLQRFFKISEIDADLYLAMYTTTTKEYKSSGNEDEFLAGQIDTKGSTNQTQFMGSAIFKEGRMIGKLNGEDTRMALIIDETADISDVLTTYPDPFNERFRIAARVIKTQPNRFDMKIVKGKLKINIHIPLYVDILSDPSMVNYAKDEKKKKILRKHLEKEISNKMEGFIVKTQQKYKGSPFMISQYSRKLFKTLEEYKKFDWMKSYPDADVNVKVTVEFSEFGKQTRVPSLKQMRD